MSEKSQDITGQIYTFIKEFTEMEIRGLVINCPYWMNKLVGGKVVLRGFLNGKGEASKIREEIIKRLHQLPHQSIFPLTLANLWKFAKRERIGIDCSGFVYRVLDQLIHFKYRNVQIKNLRQIFTGGIERTNVKTLTSLEFCQRVNKISDFRLGDIIRLSGGRHVAIIIEATKGKIVYAHSSSLSTEIQGVHTAIIRITDINKPIEAQIWEEKTRKGENFGKKYFSPKRGDGVFRLKVFA